MIKPGFSHRNLRLLLLTLLPVFAGAGPAAAKGHFNMAPRIAVTEEFNDNVYLEEDNRNSDRITTVEPGITLSWDAAQFNVALDYSLLFRYFNNNSDLNETSFKDIQRGSLQAVLFPRNNFTITAGGDISRVVVDESDRNSTENEFINRATMYHYFINPTYLMHFSSTLSARLGYRFEQTAYDQVEYADETQDFGDPNDSYQHEASFDLIKQFGSRTTITAGYKFTDFHIDNNDPGENEEDYKRHDVFLKLEEKLTSRLTLTAMGGKAFFDFEESGSENGNMWQVGLDYQATETTSYGIEYSYDYQNSVDRGLAKHEDYTAYARYDRRFSADLELFYRKSIYSEGEIDLGDFSHDRGKGASLTLSHPLGRNLSLSFFTDYARWNYRPDTEEVDNYGFGPTLSYTYRNFKFSLSYTYRRYNSDLEDNDYTNNIGFLRASWGL
jgi:hypothetical protein